VNLSFFIILNLLPFRVSALPSVLALPLVLALVSVSAALPLEWALPSVPVLPSALVSLSVSALPTEPVSAAAAAAAWA
jgi:hypothetical protein